MDFVQRIADVADVDLLLSSGRRAQGSDCAGSRHNCGLAIDIQAINGVDIGQGRRVNPEARELIERIQGLALACAAVRENYGPMGLWRSPRSGAPQYLRGGVFGSATYFADDGASGLWWSHQNHIHLGFY
jgi:hypothetical protein